MDTRFLESFIVVVECGSMAEAARRLNLTSAAIPRRIRALEAELGVRLLARSGRVVLPTEAGLAILERSKRYIGELRELKAIAAEGVVMGELRLGAINTALTGLVPDILLKLTHLYPMLEVFVKPGASMTLYSEVVEGALDAAIIVEPEFTIPKTCLFSVLREEPLIVIASLGHAGRDTLSVLRSEPFIRYDRNSWGGHLVGDYLRGVGIQPTDRLELDALEAIAVLVGRGLGVSLVPDWAPPWPEGLGIVKLPLPRQAVHRRVGVVARRSGPRQNVARALLQAVGELSAGG